jgi:hypothetical protein
MLIYAKYIQYYKGFQLDLIDGTLIIFSFLSSDRIQCCFEGRRTVGVLRLCNNGKYDVLQEHISTAFKVEDRSNVDLEKTFDHKSITSVMVSYANHKEQQIIELRFYREPTKFKGLTD